VHLSHGDALGDCNTTAREGQEIVTGINAGNTISIYPNPAAGTLQLYWNAATDGLTRIKVVDIVGRTLIQKNLKETKGTNLHQLSLDKLKNGNYILIMNAKNNCRTAMFRVQN